MTLWTKKIRSIFRVVRANYDVFEARAAALREIADLRSRLSIVEADRENALREAADLRSRLSIFEAVDTNCIVELLTGAFLQLRPLLPANRHAVTTSECFVSAFKDLVHELIGPRPISANSLYQILMASHDTGAKSAISALFASLFLDAGDLENAAKFSQLAISTNQFDVFAGAIVSKIDDARLPGRETTQSYLRRSWCNRPFTHFEVSDGGDVYASCPHWLPTPIGNLNNKRWSDIWHGETATALRESIKDGSFRYCSTIYCPFIAARTLPAKNDINNLTAARNGPGYVALSYDRSCNLACPSCREEVIVFGKSNQSQFAKIEENIDDLMAHSEIVQVTGSGDLFASNHFRKLTKKYTSEPHDVRRLNLITNAQLCNEDSWTDLNLDGNINHIGISIDAATPEIYKIVRRPGEFDRLMRNVEFLAKKRRDGEIPGGISFYFVVQAINFREMPAFVELAQGFGIDNVLFSRIRNWGTYSDAEFIGIDVFNIGHPDHAEFRDVLRNPILHKAPVIELPVLD